MSVLYVGEMNVDLGEQFHVKCEVKPKCEQELPFEIKLARYELIDLNSEIEDQGECMINGHVLDAFISPKKEGRYRLKIIYQIADETWVDNIRLKVG